MKLLSLIIGLWISVLHAAAPMDIDGVDMYPDTKPQSKQVFVVDWSEGQRWKAPETSLRRTQLFEILEESLKNKGFISLPGYCWSGTDSKIAEVFGRFVDGRLKDCFIVECQYRERSLATSFGEATGRTDGRIYRSFKEKWHIRSKDSDVSGLTDYSCTELSWKWVDFSIHSMNFFIRNSYEDITSPNGSLFCKRLYETIRRKGLEHTLMRIAVVVNKDFHYSFHAIYETQEQENVTTEFLTQLQKEL
jgi:hypothetical protein